jgi:hypothetical protein
MKICASVAVFHRRKRTQRFIYHRGHGGKGVIPEITAIEISSDSKDF